MLVLVRCSCSNDCIMDNWRPQKILFTRPSSLFFWYDVRRKLISRTTTQVLFGGAPKSQYVRLFTELYIWYVLFATVFLSRRKATRRTSSLASSDFFLKHADSHFYFSLRYLHRISIEYYLEQLLIENERPYSRISL